MRVHEPMEFEEDFAAVLKKQRGASSELSSSFSSSSMWDINETDMMDFPSLDLDPTDLLNPWNTSNSAPMYELPMDAQPMEVEAEEHATSTEDSGEAAASPRYMEASVGVGDVGGLVSEPVSHSRVAQLSAQQELWHKRAVELHRLKCINNAQLAEVKQLKITLEKSIAELEQLRDAEVLSVDDVFTVHWLTNRLQTLIERTKLVAASHVNADECVTMVFTDVPLAKGFKNKNRARASNRKKQAHVAMTAEVLCAPGVTFEPTSDVVAHMYRAQDDEQVAIQIQNNQEEMGSDNRVRFNFRFPAGTRNKPHTLRLHLQGTVTMPDGRQFEHTLVSDASNELIVTTNECQWERAEEKLLIMDVFSESSESSWARFVNALQVLWSRCTRQEAESGIVTLKDRPLMRAELEYFARSFFPDAPTSVTEKQVQAFFKAFGPVAHVFRHNVVMRTMLMEGIVWGFMERGAAEQLLANQNAGTFVVRTSSSPHSFVISVVTEQGTVRHAKLEPKQLLPPISNFADMLGNNRALINVMQPHLIGSDGTTKHVITKRYKDDALMEFYSQKPRRTEKASQEDSGYADLERL